MRRPHIWPHAKCHLRRSTNLGIVGLPSDHLLWQLYPVADPVAVPEPLRGPLLQRVTISVLGTAGQGGRTTGWPGQVHSAVRGGGAVGTRTEEANLVNLGRQNYTTGPHGQQELTLQYTVLFISPGFPGLRDFHSLDLPLPPPCC